MSRETKPDFYQILGVSQGAEDVVIRAAYRALIQRYHPDKVDAKEKPHAQIRIQAIQEAYRVLSDPVSRSQFDRHYRGQSGKTGFAVTKASWQMPHSRFVNPLDEQSWEALLHFHPQLTEHFSRLTKTDPVIAKEYKTFLTELVAERVMAKVVKRVSQETQIKEAQEKEVPMKAASVTKAGSVTKTAPRRIKKTP